MTQTARVSLAKTVDREAGVRAAIELLRDTAASFRGRHVVLKPNFNSDDPFPAATHNDAAAAIITWLKDAGAREITVAERSGIAWDSHRVAEAKGLHDLFERLGVRYVILDDLAAEDWVAVPLEGGHWRRGIEIPRLYAEAEAVVMTCCLKTHAFGGHFTMSLKNAVGLVPLVSAKDGYEYMQELHSAANPRQLIAEINQAFTPDLIVLDGLSAFITGGPYEGEVVHPGVILASRDRIAIDAVGVAILRMYDTTDEVKRGQIFDLDQLRYATELGLGVGSPDSIELVAADDPESRAMADAIRVHLHERQP